MLIDYCPACQRGQQGACDPIGYWCTCWACLPNDHEKEGSMTTPDEIPEQTDNRPRPEDGEQDVSQDPGLAYDELED